MPTLYIVATPIGNLGDFSPRAVQTLQNCALIAAEDTRVTHKLLAHFGIATPMLSNHQYNEAARAEQLVARMLEEDLAIALVTDAGTPCISDPGYILAARAAEAGIPVLTVPGPTAMAAALSVSGFDVREFAFYGFLPRGNKDLREKLLSIARGVPVAVVHESPHRVLALLACVEEHLPGAQVCACCDLTKLYEATLRGPVPDVFARMRTNPNVHKGEYCLVFDWRGVELPPEPAEAPELSLELRLLAHMLEGDTLRGASEALQAAGGKRNDLYKASMRVKEFLQSKD